MVLEALIVTGLGAAIVWGARYYVYRLDRRWGAVARRLGLRYVPGISMDLGMIEGTVDGIAVLVETVVEPVERRSLTTVMKVTCPEIPDRLRISRSSFRATATRLIEPTDNPIGDPDFDAKYRIIGVEEEVLAALSHSARRAVENSVGRLEARLESGEITIRVPGVLWNASHLEQMITSSIQLASELRLPPAELPSRLLDNVRSDPRPGVRLRNLHVLLRTYPNHEQTAEAIRSALHDRSDQVRFEAAIRVGRDAWEALIQLLQSHEANPEVRAKATTYLAERLDDHSMFTLIDELLEDDDSTVRRAAIVAAGKLKYSDAIDHISRIVAEAGPDTSIDIAEAIAAAGDKRHEPAMIQLLRAEEDDVKLAAMSALEKIGTAFAVERLRQVQHSAPRDSLLHSYASAAISHIQGRLGNVDPGRLSLTEETADHGNLSISNDGGSLSFSTESDQPPRRGPLHGQPGADDDGDSA